MKLKDAQKAIGHFIEEVKKCAENDCGFSAMLTIFSVIFAVSEAIYGKKPKKDRELIKNFIVKMSDVNWFMSNGQKVISTTTIVDTLSLTRDSLSHQISLPKDVWLINNQSEKGTVNDSNISYIIAVKEFILSVEETVNKLINDYQYSTAELDQYFILSPNRPRAIGIQILGYLPDGTITSGSASKK